MPDGHPAEGHPLIQTSTTEHPLYEAVCDACRSVHDPRDPGEHL